MLHVRKKERQQSDAMIVITNLCPLYGLIVGAWTEYDLLWLYWLETLVIGLLYPVRVSLLCSDDSDVKRKMVIDELQKLAPFVGFFAMAIVVAQIVFEQKFIMPLENVSAMFFLFLGILVVEPVYRLLMAASENRRCSADELSDDLGPRVLTLFGAFVIGILSMGFMAFGLIVAKTGIEVAMNHGVLSFGEPEYPASFDEWKAGLTEKDRQRMAKLYPGGIEQAEAYMKKQIERQQRKKQKRQSNTP
ncbi:DUF6498-containing protein [Kistimonas asteriae]|uniref:DUF6498-containing protein n=1 Tax=Kistimonas asteriae TaxID=517724 RepID=UPI001BA74DFE|nr:DUF6498-containing protein [Kistimonas asteriae]